MFDSKLIIMKKLILFSSLVVLTSLSPTSSNQVYICNSPYAKRYHLTLDCKAFENCSHDVLKLNLDEAKKKGLTKCKIEN
jgi:hypothetical protein